jgi:hypothetical protein
MKTLFAVLLLTLVPCTTYAGTIQPESIIKFPDGTLICLEREDLQKVLDYGGADQITKMASMMVQNGGGCMMIDPAKRMKVISAEYNNPAIDMGLLEVVGEKTISEKGAWTVSAGAVVVKKPPITH